MNWHRQDYIDLMSFQKTDRPMLVELFGPLIGLEDEWRSQGASVEELDLTAFDFDRVDTVSCGGNTGIFGGFEPKVLEDNSQYTIELDSLGRRIKLPKGFATIGLPMDYPVKDMDSWLKVKQMFTFRDKRINWDEVEAAKKAQNRGALVVAWMQGGFDLPRELMGEEVACLSYYENPELMQDIIDTVSDTTFRVLDRISDILVIDNLSVHEDMAGKSGPLVGPKLVGQYINPYYRRIWDMLASKGTRLFSQDSDGNMNPVIDAFLDGGINIAYPAEPAAGMDIVALRKKYGERLAFKGGIDKHVLRQGRAAIRDELEYKLQPVMRSGTVFGLDHRIPNGTPLANYRYYVDTAREILGLPQRGEAKGWARMAF